MDLRDLFDGLADAVAPLLALLALLNPLIRPHLGDRRVVVRYLVATALGVALVYLIAGIDFALGLWPRAGLDFSTHTAFVTTLLVSLWAARPGWIWGLGTTFVGYAALLVGLGFHSIGDVVVAAILAAAVTWPLQRLPGSRPK